MKRLLWLILAAEAAAVLWLQSPWITPDSIGYLRMAAGDEAMGALRAPGYPLFIALLKAIGLGPLGFVAVQMLLYLAAVWLLDRFVVRDSRPTFLALCAIYVFPLFYVASILSEGLAIFCIAVALALVTCRTSRIALLVGGVAMGWAVITRPDLILALFALPLSAFTCRNWRGAIPRALAILAGSVLVVLPYMIWNKAHFGSFSPLPVESTVGQSLYIASWEGEASYEDLQMIAAGAPPTPSSIRSGLAQELSGIRASGGTSDDFKAVALKRMAAHPLDTAWHSVKAVWRLFNSARYPAPPLIAFGLAVLSNILWFLGMVGMALYARKVLLVPALLFWPILVPHLPLHTEARYTAPIRLILLVYAALLIGKLLRLGRDRLDHRKPNDHRLGDGAGRRRNNGKWLFNGDASRSNDVEVGVVVPIRV